MDWKLELVAVPVADVDRAKAFYVDQVGFVADHDHTVSDEIRFVQCTPPGSACSIAFGRGVVDAPGVPLGAVRVLSRPRRQRMVGARAPGAMSSRAPKRLVSVAPRRRTHE